MAGHEQTLLFEDVRLATEVSEASSSTFVNNMSLPVHRWFRYSAGFSAEWTERVIRSTAASGAVRCFDPFSGSATTLIAAEAAGVESCGIDSHPFVARIAQAKLAYRSDPGAYRNKANSILRTAGKLDPDLSGYPSLIRECFDEEQLRDLDTLRQAYELEKDDSPASELVWLTLVSILRRVSTAGTAQWQYILPKKKKCVPKKAEDMRSARELTGPKARFLQADARACDGVADASANLVITSPPYPNNYDYADATRLEMSFMREIKGWGCLQETVRKHLVRSCSQHVPEKAVNLGRVLAAVELDPIRDELAEVCHRMADIRLTKGGKKTYHLMVACYFRDLALVWKALRRVCDSPSDVCFVIGDSAPYGIYVPVIPWMGKLALASGFRSFEFEKTRDRNIKWKNRKHRVPLQEGRLWVKG
jgi:hypothetical protein